MNNMISIIVPVFNAVSYVDRCIESILVQTFTNWELILIDDGSSDGSGDICDQYAEQNDNILVIHQNNQGVSAARNIGIEVAKGDYIGFVDADDVIFPYAFQEANTVVMETNADFIVGGVKRTSDLKLPSINNKKENLDYDVYDENGIKSLIPFFGCLSQTIEIEDFYISRGSVARIIRKEIAKKTLFKKDLAIGEDLVWNLELLLKCKSLCIVKSLWYSYYVNLNSATNRFDVNMYSKTERTLNVVYQMLNMQECDEYKTYVYLIYDYMCMIRKSTLVYYPELIDRESVRKIHKQLYSNSPWISMGDKRFIRCSSGKMHRTALAYHFHILFLYWDFRRSLGRIKRLGKGVLHR